MSLGTINYSSSYFKCNTPTLIRRVPNYKEIKRLKKELQVNASSIETNLGGGDHVCLGLVPTNE